MKKYILTVFLLVSAIGYTQNGINYKAVIKDDLGTIMANQAIGIQFSILQEATTVYQETHSPTTDDNGIIIVNIGEGTVVNGVFDNINWSADNHFLNVQINTGSGLVDLGTTQFMAVPYALSASNVKGLEAINEGSGVGWRLVGRNPDNYGNIGGGAIDLSYAIDNAQDYGASGTGSFTVGFNTIASNGNSVAFGFNTTASGIRSTAMGLSSHASGGNSTAMGEKTTAAGLASTAMGNSTNSDSFRSVAIGSFNIGGGMPNDWIDTDPLFEIGNSIFGVPRSNAMTVLKNGNVGIGIHTPDERLHIDNGRLKIGTETIEDGGNNALRFNARLLPDNNDVFSMGSASLRWTTIYATNGSINTSDRREKKNIKDLDYGLDEVLKMNPVSFNWKNRKNPETKLGLIAQDLLEIVPEVVKTHEWKAISEDDNAPLEKVELDRLGVYYSDLIPVLIKAIQEQQDIIENQKSMITKQDKTNMEQSKVLETLLSRVDALENTKNQ